MRASARTAMPLPATGSEPAMWTPRGPALLNLTCEAPSSRLRSSNEQDVAVHPVDDGALERGRQVPDDTDVLGGGVHFGQGHLVGGHVREGDVRPVDPVVEYLGEEGKAGDVDVRTRGEAE